MWSSRIIKYEDLMGIINNANIKYFVSDDDNIQIRVWGGFYYYYKYKTITLPFEFGGDEKRQIVDQIQKQFNVEIKEILYLK